jgi:L-ascorbate metabolism protein UlaG (beta-lactamase superfamily)
MENFTFKNATRPAVNPAAGERAAHGSASSGEKRSDEGGTRSKYRLVLPVVPGREQSRGQNEEHNAEQNAHREHSGSITFVGTATVIIRYAGLTIMTDPNFLHAGDHVHLGYGLTSKRLTNPAIELGNLPPIDLIVLSHMHEDHFDRYVQRNLDRNIPIVTTLAAAQILGELGFLKLYPLGTWETFTVEKGDAALDITSTPGRHGPPVVAKLLPEVMGSILDFASKGRPEQYRMYISGDTMVFKDIHEIPKRYPGVHLALLHLGGTRLLGLVTVTMDAKEGVEMMRIIVPEKAIPIHYNDYDVFKSPLSDFAKEIEQAGLKDRIIYLKHGDQYDFQMNIG